MTGPTPGPWQTSLSDDTVVIHIGKDGVHYEVASIAGDGMSEPDLWSIMEANARLIAAAPDLFAACQLFVKYDEPDDDDIEMMLNYDRARAAILAAIAKATS